MYIFLDMVMSALIVTLCISRGFLHKNFFPDRPQTEDTLYSTFIYIEINKDRCRVLYFFEEGGTVRRRNTTVITLEGVRFLFVSAS